MFDQIVEAEMSDPNVHYEVRCSYVEIYNETLVSLHTPVPDPAVPWASAHPRIFQHPDHVSTLHTSNFTSLPHPFLSDGSAQHNQHRAGDKAEHGRAGGLPGERGH